MKIHTLEFKSILSNDLYYKIQERIKNTLEWNGKKDNVLYWGMHKCGIILELHHKSKKVPIHTISYRISARRMFEPENYVGLFDCNQIKALIGKAGSILSAFSPLLPELKACSLTRLDFCTNLALENQKQVRAYIKLMQRAAMPKGFFRKEYYDKTAKRKKPLQDDFTIFRRNDMELSIYNKYRQMKKEMERNKKLDFPDIEAAKNIVRIELRCLPKRLNQLKQKYGLRNWTELFERAEEIGTDLYEFYLQKLFGHGDFYTIKELRERIAISEFPEQEQEDMLGFVKEASVCRSLDKAKEYLYGTCFHGKMKHLLAKFDLIAASPAAIPREERKLFPKKEPVPNPIVLLHDAWEQE